MTILTSWSYSGLKDYESCPQRTKLKAEKASTPPFVENRGTAVHRLAEQYIKGEIDPLPKDLGRFHELFDDYRIRYAGRAITLEEEWGFTATWEPCPWYDAWLRVKTDLFERVEDDSAVIVDWKTGKSFMNAVPHMQQAQFYALAAFMRVPELHVVETRFVYLDEGKSIFKMFSRDKDLPRLYQNYMQRAGAMFFDEEFKPKPNRMTCRYCPYSPNEQGSGACAFGTPWNL